MFSLLVLLENQTLEFALTRQEIAQQIVRRSSSIELVELLLCNSYSSFKEVVYKWETCQPLRRWIGHFRHRYGAADDDLDGFSLRKNALVTENTTPQTSTQRTTVKSRRCDADELFNVQLEIRNATASGFSTCSKMSFSPKANTGTSEAPVRRAILMNPLRRESVSVASPGRASKLRPRRDDDGHTRPPRAA